MKIAFISDIHEDLLSLEKAFRIIKKRKCNETICLGDISGYSVGYYSYAHRRDAHACLNIIRQNCKYIVLGNHDLHAARMIPEISPLFNYPKNWYSLDYYEQKELAQEKLWLYSDNELDPLYDKKDVKFLQTLNYQVIHTSALGNILLTHYIYPNLSGATRDYYLKPNDFYEHFSYMEKQNCTYAIAGHAHPDGLQIITQKKVIKDGYCRKMIPKEPSVIICPSVSGSKNRNGFLIFDIHKSVIEAVQI
jgi:predicted phosphodiesterase